MMSVGLPAGGLRARGDMTKSGATQEGDLEKKGVEKCKISAQTNTPNILLVARVWVGMQVLTYAYTSLLSMGIVGVHRCTRQRVTQSFFVISNFFNTFIFIKIYQNTFGA